MADKLWTLGTFWPQNQKIIASSSMFFVHLKQATTTTQVPSGPGRWLREGSPVSYDLLPIRATALQAILRKRI
ncbi:hypothetical protein HZ326_2967 [Fusarium oxysporum f. sp. albedinis]|nr:hypothetical protein HZ326_2967 [Fusarium oxysporum f. sp. albedinis]